jgi:hypothetical protein
MGWACLIYTVFLTTPIQAFAHGGGLDSMGCHHNKKLGGYHCHQGQLAGQEFSSLLRTLKGAPKECKNTSGP